MPASQTSVEERLFSLVLALMASENGLTKADILSTVQGYSRDYVIGGANVALERKFERDKDDLRALGIPLETIESPDRPGDNTALRYLIPKRLYDLPNDIEFSAQEIGLLALAGAVWREGSLSADSRRAMLKLSARGVETSEPLVGYAPRIRLRDAAFEPLQTAQTDRAVVSFPYLKPGEASPRRRTVLPLAVVQHDGRWHLYAHDLDAGARRTFLLSRIVGSVVQRPDLPAPDIDATGAGEQAKAELAEVSMRNTAVLEIRPETDAAIRLAHRGTAAGNDRISLHFTDLDIIADELASYGPEVLVVEPADLRTAVHARLVQVARHHGWTGADRG
ncbi:MAG: WYL domain-containing protein [Leifsonia sp.]